jgi:hypothetical protein
MELFNKSKIMQCQKDRNLKNCPCTYLPAGRHGPDCSRKGICCDCLSYHLKRQELPACCFLPEVEKTYDRSIENFIKNQEGNK